MKGHPVFMVNLLSTVLSTRPPSKEQHKLEMEDQAELEQYYKDSRSIYVGNLPPCANEDLVRLITTPCGVVLSIQMKQVTSTSGKLCAGVQSSLCLPFPSGAVFRHAFVEFDNTESPNMAVQYCVSVSFYCFSHSIVSLIFLARPSGRRVPNQGSEQKAQTPKHSSANSLWSHDSR